MQTVPLIFKDGHLFAEIEGHLWLYDTGAPISFGDVENLTIDNERFDIEDNFLGHTATQISQFVGTPCIGLLGTDILRRFDHILDCVNGTLTISTDELERGNSAIHLEGFMNIPVIEVKIADQEYHMFFDTGAQISYFQDDSLSGFPEVGSMTDFLPSFGQFETPIHQLIASLGDDSFSVRCGRLPGLLGLSLILAETQGIIGNEILANRTTRYFPRRRLLCL